MSAVEGIFSLRIVTADFYMEKPKPGLDPCFSEFRAKEIKKVPIIRIFGSNTEGQKTCMHVHGVFPYLYIPCDKKDFETVDKAVYLIASSIDKAINISLGQGSSPSQHVFKIQLVKGIPFYGYHQKEHQYFKIYMLNPRFVRRAANLLQNGAIMGKIFQPHESHVPYILQFFIDYNLYGMSFLHVPKEVLKFRQKDEQDVIPYSTQKGQVLDCNVVAKQSTSALELDIGSAFILNRFQLITKTSSHTNPGIEAIWQDERVRRQKLSKDSDEVPPLEVPVSQGRPNVKPTESEDFYRHGLINKLQQLEMSMDQTMNATLQTTIVPAETSNREKKRTFNLKKLIANAVYPEECTQDDILTNASFIADHLSNHSMFHTSMRFSETPSIPDTDDVYMDDTIVDEELVLSLTQPDYINQSLGGQDLELLEVMQQLEERDDENDIDLDSTLAPLSQNLDSNSPRKVFDSASTGVEISVIDSPNDDSDNECLNDFTMVMDDMDELLLKLTQSSQPSDNIPPMAQCDGADDTLQTPTKNKQRKLQTSPKTPVTPKRTTKITRGSPRTPNSVAKKYAPLPLIIQSRSLKKHLSKVSLVQTDDDEVISVTSEECETSEINTHRQRKLYSLRKKLALTELKKKTISTDTELEDENTPLSNLKRKRAVDLDKTHITCNLRTPRRTSERRLKVYDSKAAPESEPLRPAKDLSILEYSEDQLAPRMSPKDHAFITKITTVTPSKAHKASISSSNEEISPRVILKKCSHIKDLKAIEGCIANMNYSELSKKANTDLTRDHHLALVAHDKPINGRVTKCREELSNSDNVEETPISTRGVGCEVESETSLIEKRKITTNIVKPSFTYNIPRSNAKNTTPRVLLKRSPRIKEFKLIEETIANGHACSNAQISPLRSSAQNELVTPLKSNSKISPRVLLKKHSKILDLVDDNITGGMGYSSCQTTNNAETSFASNEFNTPTRNKTKITPRALLKKSPRFKEIRTNVVEGIEHSTKTEITTKITCKSNETNISPSVLLRRHPGIMVGGNIANQKCTNSSFKDNSVSKKGCKLSLTRRKKKKNVQKCEDKLPSGDNVEGAVIPSSAISKSSNKEESYSNTEVPNTSSSQASLHRNGKNLGIKLKRVKLREIETLTSPKQIPKTPNVPKKPYTIIVNNKYEITPIAGPSHLDRFKITNISTPKRNMDDQESSSEDDPTVHSFYEKSFVVDSPSVFSEISIPSPGQLLVCSQHLQSLSADKVVIITPHVLPETYQEVEQNCKIYDIPDMVHQKPFYSNYADVTQRKEVGHTVLCIPGKSLNDLEEFQSTISDLKGFSERRKKKMQTLGGSLRNDDRIREYLSTEKSVLITPCNLPPTKQDAKVWIKARELVKGKNVEPVDNDKHFEEDSPIKIRRQKVVMMMENESGESGEDVDCSMRSISLTPLTPVDVRKNKAGDNYDCTPLTAPKSIRRRSSLWAKVSLSQKLMDICVSNTMEKCSGADVPPTIKCVPTDNLLKAITSSEDDIRTSQESERSNETITSEAVLAELEKSSFVRNLHGSQGSNDASFGLSIATLNNTFGFKVNLENLQQAKSDVEHNYLTTLSLEVFVSTRDHLLPDPSVDAILCIFYAIENSIPSNCTDGESKAYGFIIVSDGDSLTSAKFNGIDSDVEIKTVNNELEGLVKLLDLIAYWDPDIFAGYEIEMSSWGYIMERAKYLQLNIAPLLSRVPSQKVRDFIDEDRDQLTDLDVETKLCGRILLDVWRLMRSEIALTSYTFENVMYHILHRRCPRHTHRELTQWFLAPQTRWIVLEYYLERVRGTLELLDQLDLIGRTSEMAKLIGIQFYEVLSRGSQFRVESMMLRIAKPKNLVPLSPSVQQRAHMRAPEYLALILEPESRFYPDPVIVLDFQSLYPSMIMAYNYCFSTCLGRVEHLGQSVPFEFGASQLRVSPTLLGKLLENDLVTISPCGVVYVKREIREGILPRMLTEVLDTRQMVKQSMKLHKNSTALQRILHSRQLGLKLIANVTYGYTAANFSGRMPCVEVGDSVVAKGRETLERAIKLVEANEKWNVRVVYGDTDSLFVLVPGRSRAEAFKIGAEIAELVTQDNPQPVKLKLEKVYQPCILQTKKRYVGYMYETPDQEAPVYEAKGIETVRRDGCPAAAKMLEKCLRILFDSADVSQVKNYVCRQFTKLLSGKANIQDLIFAKEFRGLNGYKPTACVPALELTRKWMQVDPRKIPRRGERVPFIVTNGPPGLPLIRLVRSPHDVLADEGLKINAIYYITKAIIPPLNRCFLLIGADVNEWFTNLPRKILFTPALSAANEIIGANSTKKSTISQYFSSTNCIIDCGRQTKQGICTLCSGDVTKSMITVEEKISKLERGYHLTQMICQACCGRPNFINCGSLDCPVLYVLEVKRRDLGQITHIRNIIDECC